MTSSIGSQVNPECLQQCLTVANLAKDEVERFLQWFTCGVCVECCKSNAVNCTLSCAGWSSEYHLCTQGQQRKSALLEYFHATGKAKIKAVVYVS